MATFSQVPQATSAFEAVKFDSLPHIVVIRSDKSDTRHKCMYEREQQLRNLMCFASGSSALPAIAAELEMKACKSKL